MKNFGKLPTKWLRDTDLTWFKHEKWAWIAAWGITPSSAHPESWICPGGPRWLVFDLHGCDFGFVGCCFLRAGRQISRLYLSSLGCFWKLWSVKWHQNSTEPPDLLNNVKMSPWVKTSTVNHGEPKNSWLMLVVHWSGIVSFTQSPVSPSSRHKWDDDPHCFWVPSTTGHRSGSPKRFQPRFQDFLWFIDHV